ncbi:MAG: CBS domain-containing protein [Anaerolineaceae bacterium]|nr:CBS domain-containing protein [Anaerolineaceae bacterium]
MRLILTHDQADLDGLASLLAAKLLDPQAYALLPKMLNLDVQAFLRQFGDELGFSKLNELPAEPAESVLLVDTQAMLCLRAITPATQVRVIDHHPRKTQTKPDWQVEIGNSGACTTLLVKQIRQQGLRLNVTQATLLLLGIYEDTGSLTYATTTSEDAYAAAWLLEQGADLNIAAKYLETPLSSSQKILFDRLLKTTETLSIEGKTLLLAHADAQDIQDEISTVAHQLRDFLAGDGLILLISTRQGVRIVGRSSTDEVDAAKLARKYGGGGHLRAASALVHQERHASPDSVNSLLQSLYQEVKSFLPEIVCKGPSVSEIMSRSFLYLEPHTPVSEIQELMLRYGFEGYPVMEDGRAIGLVTRRTVDRALSHHLEADARALMDAGEVSIPAEGSLSQLRDLMTSSGWGQIPVTQDGKISGIVTRTDLMKALKTTPAPEQRLNMKARLESQLAPAHLALLRLLAKEAEAENLPIYIVGGFVRDLILGHPSLDFDVVLEGPAIDFAKTLAAKYGGKVIRHDAFGTAKWSIAGIQKALVAHLESVSTLHAEDLPESIDLISSRNEYYKRPAALPTVEPAGIKLDLRRRDFSINTMAVRLDGVHFGEFLDFWGGHQDLKNGLIRVLHSLSFVDDATRILRALRFAVRFDFRLEPRTEELLLEGRKHLSGISPARLRNETDLIFSEEAAPQILEALEKLGVLSAIHPALRLQPQTALALQTLNRPAPSWQKALPTGLHLNRRQALGYVLWLGFLEPEHLQTLSRKLNLPAWLEDAVLDFQTLQKEAPALLLAKPSQVVHSLEALEPFALEAAALADQKGALSALMEEYMTRLRVVKPHTDGKALIGMGLAPSANFSAILNKLRDARLDGQINSDSEENAYLNTLLKQV